MRKIIRPVILLLAVMAFFLWGRWYFNEPEDGGITRAQAARMLAYALYDMEDGQEETRQLIDVEDGIWYFDEIQKVVINNLMQTDGDLFHPTDLLTYTEAREIAGKFQMDLDIPPLKEKSAIPLEKWLELYDEIIGGPGTVERMRLSIEAVPAISDELKPWQAKTDQGIFIYEGVPLENYVGQEVMAYVRGEQLLMAVRVSDGQVSETVQTGQKKRTEVIEADDIKKNDEENTDLTADLSEKECDIRVCLMTTGFSSEYHEKITLMSDTEWWIIFDDRIRQCTAGETVTLTASDFSADGEAAEIKAADGGEIQVLSIERSCGFPSYEGILRTERCGNSLLLVNILPLEHYLYGVVPGEMPSDYGSEALKAQAVCARSYAILALQSPKYGYADVNDSTGCQVYMNQGKSENCTSAVDATAGQVLLYDNQVVTATYFSTSCGSMSDSDDIWLFPEEAQELAHIAAKLETQPPSVPSLNDEAVFKKFIDSPEKDTYVEENASWFRWKVTITGDDIGSNISQTLKQRMAVNPKHFTLLSETGEMDSEDIESVEILERAKSGVVRKIRISGKNQELTVSGEYNIRCLLAPPSDRCIYLHDGSERQGLSLLPSGYFYLEEQKDKETATGFEIRGGGLGHGAGMSQNGARILADQGYDYEEILTYYFDHVSIGYKP